MGWPKPRNSGREAWHGPGVTVAPNQMGLGLARDPTHSLWGRRCFGSVVLGGVQLLRVVSSLVFLEGPFARGIEMRRVPLFETANSQAQGRGGRRAQKVERWSVSGGGRGAQRWACFPLSRGRAGSPNQDAEGRCWRRLCAHPGGRGQPRPLHAAAPPLTPRGL